MKIIAVIAVSGREDILKITIPRLVKQVYKVIVAGHSEKEYIPGTDFYICDPKMKRGAKWQFCVDKAREYFPDTILISSSGGVFTDSYFDVELSDMTGSRTLYYLDYQPRSRRMIYWKGYPAARSREPVGLGRIISAQFLDKCKWQIFDKDTERGCDSRTWDIFQRYEGKVKLITNNPPLRISSYKYVQTDPFDRIAKMSTSVVIEEKDIDGILKHYGL